MDKILLSHGSGGKLTHELINKFFLEAFSNPILEKLDDSAIFEVASNKIAFSTDSYVVDPIFFKGGDIGKLAICGTVNDLSMSGATPLYLSVSFIIEEGFSILDLQRIILSMKDTALKAGIKIITGDTKVVEKGSADKIFINTTGIGIVSKEINISGSNAQEGDIVIVSGKIGEHGMAILSEREGLKFDLEIESDCAPLNTLVSNMLKVTKNIHCLRDLTRGGLVTALNEIANQSNVGIFIEESAIPIGDGVKGASEMLGLDPLYIACEGRLICILPTKDVEEILAVMQKNEYGREAKIIGKVVNNKTNGVYLQTEIGGTRIAEMIIGEQLPRIC
ncbi:MAG: hydrogenase expression/formation protein HypE [bacterium]|nr:hydrogenase expression/formation protein HypE [bacterium]